MTLLFVMLFIIGTTIKPIALYWWCFWILFIFWIFGGLK